MPQQVLPYSNTQLYSKGNLALVNGSIWRYKGTSATTTGRSTIYIGEFIEADWENVGAQLARADIEAAMVEASCAGKYWKWNAGGTAVEYVAGSGGGGLADGNYGDVTVSGTGTVITINNDTVTNAKAANMATQTIKGRNTAGTGDPEDLAPSTVKTMLSLVKADVGLGSVVNADTTTTANITDSTNKRFITDAQQTVLTNTSGTNSGNETTTTTGALINGATAKTTPVDADFIGLMDSAASNILKKLSWLNIKATLKTYFDSLYPSGSGTSTGTNTGDNSANSSSQPVNSNLTTISGLTATTNNFLIAVASAWASRTPAQAKVTLSLDNVENTALSTWAGTSNITTLGTITTGVWSGTTIVDGKIASALTGKSINGVTLTTGGSTSNFLNANGVYSAPTTVSGNAGTATALQTARFIGGVSFDGTADIIPQTIQLANEVTDTTCFVCFFTAATGNLQPKANTSLTYNSNTGSLGATTFVGALTGTASGNLVSGGALGTPSSGTLTNCTFPTLNQNTSGTAANLSGTPALPNGTTATTQTAADNSTKLATTAYVDTADALKANLASPTFTGTPTLPTGTIATTQTAGNSTTAIATTAFVTTADNLKANLASPTFTGTPTLPTGTIAVTQTAANNSTAIATTAYVDTADALKANLASPTFTGTPTLPTGTIATTQAALDSSTKLATTAFVTTADNLKADLASPTFTGTPLAPTAAAGTNTTQIATTAYAKAAAPNASYRTILDSSGSHTAARAAATYGFGHGDPLAVTGVGTLYPLNTIYIDSADYPTVNGLAPLLRIRAQVYCNDVAPTGNYIIALHPITRPATSGGVGLCIYTIGTAVTSSAATTVTAPAADSSTNVVGSDFALPANGHYVIGMVSSAPVAASAHMHMSASLQLRNA